MKGEVVTLMTNTGEIIGRVKESDFETITLANPRMFVQQDDKAGFASGVCITGAGEPEELVFRQNQILSIVPTNVDLIKAWSEATEVNAE
jgi:hypothetical protein